MRVGIIGTGLIAHQNVPALLRTGRVEIAALCNRTLSKAESFARQYGLNVPIYEDYLQMLARERLDAVLINTPHGQHCEQFLACAGKGVHVMVEKPLATSWPDCQKMKEAAEHHGIRSAVCHTQRYTGPIRTALDYMRGPGAEEMGAVHHIIDTLNIHYFQDSRPSWYMNRGEAQAGLLFAHGSHQLDRVHLFLSGPSERLCAHIDYAQDLPWLDRGYQMLGSAGEQSYAITCGGYPGVHTSTLQLNCEKGTVRISLFPNGIEQEGVYIGHHGRPFELLPCPYPSDETYDRQFTDMLDALEGKPSGAPTLDEAGAVIRLIEQVRVGA